MPRAARGEEFNLADCNGGIKLTSRYGSVEPQRHQQTLATTQLPESTHSRPIPSGTNYLKLLLNFI